MCGIIGIIGQNPVGPLLVEGLRRLEYRGYDSAGIATLTNSSISRCRAAGKLVNLEARLEETPVPGTTGIGHTRWATHGRPTEVNAHPHADDRVALVHNGIIENFQELRVELQDLGHDFETETDTEVVVHLISHHLSRQLSPEDAVFETLKRLRGAFALAIIFSGHHDLMIGARRGSPLAVGYGEGEMFLGSDALALAPMTNRISYLEEGDWVVLRADAAEVRDEDGHPVVRRVSQTALSGAMIGKGQYQHFMQKEIWEQPGVIGDTLHSLANPWAQKVTLPDLSIDFQDVSRLTISACGTAFYAGLVSRYWFEQLARLPVEIDIASEFRYREAPMPDGGVSLFISQSGETIDTLAALRYARQAGQKILSIINTPESAIARESDAVLRTHAGPEIGVASTKAFTTQLVVLACLALEAARARGALTAEELGRHVRLLFEVPTLCNEVLNHDETIRKIAADIATARDVLFVGRGSMYPIAMEGALKLKEISYIHAEGYAAGELKHGPIALVDDEVPVIVCAPTGPLFEKTVSNMQEIYARGGRVVFISDAEGIRLAGAVASHAIEMPSCDPFVAPILYAIPVQLLAYSAAVLKGTDVDQPRNLAKSVTVE